MNKRKFLYEFLHTHELTALATCGLKGKPEAAVMQFGETKNLELIFGTPRSTRKFKNLKRNSSIAFVIGWDKGDTVQYEGKAVVLTGAESQKYKNIFFTKIPSAKQWEGKPGMTYFLVTPTWIRFTALKKDPWEIFL